MGSEETKNLSNKQEYTLTILNENTKFQQFVIFQKVPSASSYDPFSLAWMVGGASVGAPGSFETISQMGVRINSANTVGANYQGQFSDGVTGLPNEPVDDTQAVTHINADDALPTVAVRHSENVSLNVGLAMAGKSAIAVQLKPNLTYQFKPNPTYYIIAGSFVQGQVIDTAISSAAYDTEFQDDGVRPAAGKPFSLDVDG
ncbi:hypothetical protein GOZ78_11050 [Agrobacterium vitis]|uniref:Uncharacterized protein n=1 Tax=Agrobacterium vitis TaxID=373 RepID=A0ABD6GHI5_AGRVI|nr:hypothetical protein [Agrobacterium vitis]MUO81198.1 hypothetical protein [Agrobacterium vitis]MUO95644.1 hypothetical protein [Agrobacterium vitis]MUP06879.1 hypothetical protein [Agrobacterium vitis]MUZ84659.1 hypothetical protein [Agrobacterium vitis]MVA10568.1 hypothetical protein [Agrobacterium vitis]